MNKHDIETQVRRELRRKAIAQIVLVLHSLLFFMWFGFDLLVILNSILTGGFVLRAIGANAELIWLIVNVIWIPLYIAHAFSYHYFYGRLKQRREAEVMAEVERRHRMQEARAKLKNDEIFYEDDAYVVGDDGELYKEKAQ